MRRDDSKTLFIVFIVCIICLLTVLFFSHKNNFKKLASVEDYDVFFTVNNEINSFFNLIIVGNKEKIFDILDKNFVVTNNLNNSNVLSNFDFFNTNCSFKVKKMDYVKIGKNFLYFVNGQIIENTFIETEVKDENFKIIVLHDISNNTYAIYPVFNNNYKEVINSIKKINISKSTFNNIVKNYSYTDVDICKLYFADYYDKLINDIDGAYKLLNSNMLERFSNYADFEKYILDNTNKITSSTKLCKMDKYGNERIYTVIDSNENSFVFYENGIMKYKVNISFNKNS